VPVKDQAQRVEQIAFAYAVLPYDDDIPAEGDIQLGKIPKIRDANSRKIHPQTHALTVAKRVDILLLIARP